MFKFVQSSSNGLPLKRKQIQRACQPCRRRKKRCPHISAAAEERVSPSSSSLQVPANAEPHATPASARLSAQHQHGLNATSIWPSQKPQQHFTPASDRLSSKSQQHITTISNDEAISSDTARESGRPTDIQLSPGTLIRQEDAEAGDESRFVGHLNPQGIFLAATRPETAKSSEHGDKVGVWLPRSTKQDVDKKDRSRTPSLYTHDPFVSKVLLPYMADASLRLLPDSVHLAVLLDIYRVDIYPIFPIVDPAILPHAETIGQQSHSTILLVQALCLAAAGTLKARPHLQLASIGNTMQSPADFTAYLSQAIPFGSESKLD